MAITLEQVRALLDAEEPNYAALARLGPEILPHLRTLIAGGDEYFATKAASLVSATPATGPGSSCRSSSRLPSSA